MNTFYLHDGDNKILDSSKYHRNFIQLEKYCIENYFLDKNILDLIKINKEIYSGDYIFELIKEIKTDKFLAISSILKNYNDEDRKWIDLLDASAFIELIFIKLGFVKKEAFIQKYIDKAFELNRQDEIFGEVILKIFPDIISEKRPDTP